MRIWVIWLILLFSPLIAFTQINRGNLFFTNYYSFEKYNAARQNWDIVQDSKGIIYVANSSGYLLVFDGIDWDKIPVAKVGLRSLAIDSHDRLYIGYNNGFGYIDLRKAKKIFHPLSPLLPNKYKNCGIIWQIIVLNDTTVYFQSEQRIFIYNSIRNSFEVIEVNDYSHNDIFYRMFLIDSSLFIYLKKAGLFLLKKDTIEFIKQSEKLKGSFIRGFFHFAGKLYISTFNNGLYIYEKGSFTPVKTPIDSLIKHNHYYALPLDEKHLIFTLATGGFIITDQNFRIIRVLNVYTGLQNDKILNIYVDKNKVIWLALDNGIASVYPFYPLYVYDDRFGIEKYTKVYTSLFKDSVLFLGTSTGIYYKNWKKSDFSLVYDHKKARLAIKLNPFLSIKDYNGIFKVSTLKKWNNTLLFSSLYGFGYIYNFIANYIIKAHTIRTFVIADKNTVLALSRSLTVLKYIPDSSQWRIVKIFDKIKGRIIVPDTDGYYWIASSTLGLYRVKFSSDYTKIISFDKFNKDAGLHRLPSQINNKVFRFGSQLLFSTIKGIYRYDKTRNEFYPDTLLNRLIGGNFFVNLIFIDTHGDIWVKYNYKHNERDIWKLIRIHKTDTGYYVERNLFNPLMNRIYSFSQISDSLYVIGTDNGCVLYDASMHFRTIPFNAFIKQVQTINPDSLLASYVYAGDTNSIKNMPKLPYQYRNIKFLFAANYYLSDKISFSYILQGYDKKWSEWTQHNFKEYSNLPPGKYIFKLKAKNIFDTSSSVAVYAFEILPPWYQTFWAFFLYFIMAILFVWLIVYLYTLRLKKQKEHLESLVKERTKEIEKQKNILEKQNKEITEKNREITDSITYAQRIQSAILPLDEVFEKYFDDYFILFKPRDIVSGDFYWINIKNDKIILSVVDCTGHGVPGAFMSILGYETLNTIVLGMGITEPAKILEYQDKLIKKALKRQQTETKDGMEMSVSVIDRKKNIITFAGARHPLVYIKNHKLMEIPGTKRGIGEELDIPFVQHTIEIDHPLWIYLFSDGYKDQFGGGAKMRKFMKKYFYEKLLQIHSLSGEQQKKHLEQTLIQWMKGYQQTDDILVLGVYIIPKN